MRALPAVRLRHHAVITGRPGEERVTASIGPDGNLVALWAAAQDRPAFSATTTQAGGARFPEPRASRSATARVSIHAPEPATAAELPGLPLAHVTVQPLPQGRVLVVGARSRWRPEGPDRNAIVYDADGAVVAEETLGDGIAHVFTTASGRVWVAYFDEGIYGNFGWNSPGPAPIGDAGLVRFSPDLQEEWRFPSARRRPWGPIHDCYALNLAGDTAWTCYYTDFPIVRVHDGALTGWSNDTIGIRALAVDGTRAALLGGYGAEREQLTVGTLDDGAFRVVGRYRVVLPDGQPLPPRTRAFGRGADLHLVSGDDWYRLDLDHLAPAG